MSSLSFDGQSSPFHQSDQASGEFESFIDVDSDLFSSTSETHPSITTTTVGGSSSNDLHHAHAHHQPPPSPNVADLFAFPPTSAPGGGHPSHPSLHNLSFDFFDSDAHAAAAKDAFTDAFAAPFASGLQPGPAIWAAGFEDRTNAPEGHHQRSLSMRDVAPVPTEFFAQQVKQEPLTHSLNNLPSPFSEDKSSPSSSSYHHSPPQEKKRRLASPADSTTSAASTNTTTKSNKASGGAKKNSKRKAADDQEQQQTEGSPSGSSISTSSCSNGSTISGGGGSTTNSSSRRPPPSASQVTSAGQPFPVIDTSARHSSLFVPPDTSGLTKREARLVKNRAAAFLSRQRKREQFEELEVKCKALCRLTYKMWETMAGQDAEMGALQNLPLAAALESEAPSVREILADVIAAKGASLAPTEDGTVPTMTKNSTNSSSTGQESSSSQVKDECNEAEMTGTGAASNSNSQDQQTQRQMQIQTQIDSLRSELCATKQREAALHVELASQRARTGGVGPSADPGCSAIFNGSVSNSASPFTPQPFRTSAAAAQPSGLSLTIAPEPPSAAAGLNGEFNLTPTLESFPTRSRPSDEYALTSLTDAERASAAPRSGAPFGVDLFAGRHGGAGHAASSRRAASGMALMVILFSFALFGLPGGADMARLGVSRTASGQGSFSLGRVLGPVPGSSQYTFGHKEDDKEEDKEMDTDPFEGSPSSHLSAHDLSLQSQSALPACTITDLAADVADLLPMCTLEDTATDASVQPRVLKSAWSNFTDANEGSAEPASAARRALAYRVPRARDPLDEWLGRSIGIDLSVDWLNVRASSSSSDETEGDDAQAVKSLGEYLGRSAAERGFILIGSPTDAGKGARSEMKNKSLSDEQPPESDSGAENMDVDQLTLQDTEGCEATPPTRLTLFVPTAQPSSCHADEQPASAAATNADHRPDLQSLSFDSKKAVPDANDRRDDQAQTQAQKQQQQQQRPTAPVRSASGLASPNSATRAAVLRALRQHRAAARPASSSRRISAATGAPTGAAGAFGEADADADGEGSFVELEFTLESSRTLSRQELVSLLTNAAIAPPAPVVAAAVGAGGKV